MVTTQDIICPYCGAKQTISVDISVRHQSYEEDCQACCQPIELNVVVESGDEVLVGVRRSDE